MKEIHGVNNKINEINELIQTYVKDEIICEICFRLLKEYERKKGKINSCFTKESLAGAFIYLGYRKNKTPKPLDEIACLVDVERKGIGRLARSIMRELGMKYCHSASLTGSSCMLMPKTQDFIVTIAEKLHFEPKTAKIISDAIKIANKCEKMPEVCGINPVSIAGGAVYISSLLNNFKRTQREVADASGVRGLHHKLIIKLLGLTSRIEKNEKQISEAISKALEKINLKKQRQREKEKREFKKQTDKLRASKTHWKKIDIKTGKYWTREPKNPKWVINYENEKEKLRVRELELKRMYPSQLWLKKSRERRILSKIQEKIFDLREKGASFSDIRKKLDITNKEARTYYQQRKHSGPLLINSMTPKKAFLFYDDEV